METMTLLALTFDSVLGLTLLWLAWQALSCPDLFKAIVLFIAFGLLMALAWVRLDATDIALAEAAIGAGLTGALLLAALAKLRAVEVDNETAGQHEKSRLKIQSLDQSLLQSLHQSLHEPLQWLPIIALLLVAAGLGYTVLSLPPYAAGLSAEVSTNLEASGVGNPVTAVLLNFRGYDTLLEMVVLLIALLGVWSLGESAPHQARAPGPVLDSLSRLLTPVLILVAAYLLWVGAHAPGGAFQAGSILGAAGVLLLLAGWQPHPRLMTLPLRLALVAGPATFVLMAALTLLFEGKLLQYPREYAGTLILILETSATLSIGATLVALFLGGRPQVASEVLLQVPPQVPPQASPQIPKGRT